jgi:quercetin dioxygenase-like cupin family protein
MHDAVLLPNHNCQVSIQPQSKERRTVKPQPFVVTPDAYGRALNVVGERITVLASNASTQGYEIFLQQGEEGTGPPPHSHDWDESFFVIKGNVDISYGDQTVNAKPGTLVHLPAGSIHGFRFGAGGGEMVSVTSQNGQAAHLFATLDQEIEVDSPDIPKLIAVAGKYGVTVAI